MRQVYRHFGQQEQRLQGVLAQDGRQLGVVRQLAQDKNDRLVGDCQQLLRHLE